MKFILSSLLVFLCVFAKAQTAPPMKVGGPQGIDATRLLSRDWLSVPIYIDTPVAPLTGGGWPGAAYVIQATKNYRDATIEEWLKWAEAGGLTQLDSIRWQDQEGTVYFLPKGIDTSQVLDYLLYGDTSVWHYTGKNWRRVGGNAEFYFDYLLDGGYVTQVAPASSRQFTITPAEYYLGGVRYKYDTTFRIQAPSKVADSTGRIDVIFLSTTGPRLIKGTPSRTPVKPQVRSGSIELASIYFRPFDTIPNVVNGKSISSIYRIRGRDSIYYTIDTLTFAIKDSIGISRTDTAVMLNPYKFTAANGLTKDSTVFRLGGSLNQNTDINLNTRRLTLIGGSDTTRFYANGRVSIGGTPDSLSMLRVNGTTRITGNTTYNGNLLPISSSGSLMVAGFTRGASTNDPARLQTYTNQGGAPTQYFNFRYFTTDLVRDDIVFDSVAFNYNFYNLGLNGIATSNRGGGNTFNSLLINPTIRIGARNTQQSYFRGVSFSPVIDSANNVVFIPYSNTVGSNMLNTTSGNTRIGYPLATTTTLNNTAIDTTFKLDVNGQSRFTNHVNITNGGYLKIPDNNKIQLGVGGPSQNYNTFITSVFPSSEGSRNTHIGYVDGYTGNSGTDNTIIGSVNNRTNVTGISNVIVGTNNRNYLNGTGTQNNSIIIGQGMYTPDAFNMNQVGYFGFDGDAIGGTLSSHLGFFSGHESRESNAIVFGRSGPFNATYNNVYFNGVRGSAGNAGNSITLNAASAGNATDRNGGNITIAGGKGTGNGTPGAVIFSTSTRLPNAADTTTLQTLAERARITPTGNLLVNRQSQLTADTIYKLDVNGNVRLNGWVDDTNVPGNSGNWGKNVGTGIYFANTVSDVGLKVGAGVDGTSRFILKNNGNIITSGVNNFGIGTITPTAKLHVSNNTDSTCFKVEDRFNRDSATLVDQTPFIIHNNGDVSVGTAIDDTSSKVNIVSTTKGFLQPRMTNTQRDAITTPATGLQLFSTTDSANYVYRGTGGGWQKIANEISGSNTLDFGSTSHGTSSDITFTVTGAAEGDVVALGIPNSAIVANGSFIAWVSAANTITVRFNNYASSGSSDPGSGLFKVKVFK